MPPNSIIQGVSKNVLTNFKSEFDVHVTVHRDKFLKIKTN